MTDTRVSEVDDVACSSVPTVVAGSGEFTAQVFAEIPPEHRIVFRRGDLSTPQSVARDTAGADAVVVDYEILTAEHIQAMAPSVKIIGFTGTGVDSIDVEAARARGIAVAYMPGISTNEVADHTVALILAGLRRLKTGDEVARSGWGEWRRVGSLRGMADTTVGLVGLGRIGHAILSRLVPFGSSILVFDPVLTEPPPEAALASSLEELLIDADVVSLQVPLTPGTRQLIGAEEFTAMKSHALLVNTSRGGVVDEEALAAALQGGVIGGAALDVVATEPLPPNAPILQAPNTLLTPHIAWYSVAAERRARDYTLHAVAAYVRGEDLPYGVLATDS